MRGGEEKEDRLLDRIKAMGKKSLVLTGGGEEKEGRLSDRI